MHRLQTFNTIMTQETLVGPGNGDDHMEYLIVNDSQYIAGITSLLAELRTQQHLQRMAGCCALMRQQTILCCWPLLMSV
jgi:hypothetical protein